MSDQKLFCVKGSVYFQQVTQKKHNSYKETLNKEQVEYKIQVFTVSYYAAHLFVLQLTVLHICSYLSLFFAHLCMQPKHYGID